MNYEYEFNFYYNNLYNRVERRIKKSFINQKEGKVTFNSSISNIHKYLRDLLELKFHSITTGELSPLYNIFQNRHSYYEDDELNLIFENQILKEFNQIKLNNNIKYEYKILIKKLAFTDALKETLRLLQNNSRLYEMHYKLNDFENFKIEERRHISLENYPMYVKLHKKLNPEYYKKTNQNDIFVTDIDKPHNEQLSTRQKILLIEKLILNVSRWQNTSENKKAIIIAKILGTSDTNIRNNLALFNKKTSSYSKKLIAEIAIVESIINDLA